MRIMTLLLLLVSAASVHAEVYKCYTASKKVSYQPTPCTGGSEKQNVIEIEKQSPQQIEEAQRQLNAVETERMQRDEAAQLQHDKELEQQKLDAAQREATAARQEAAAARRDAEAARQSAEQARQSTQYPMIITYPRYNNYGRYNTDGNHHEYDYRNNQSPVVTPDSSPSSVPKSMSPYSRSTK